MADKTEKTYEMLWDCEYCGTKKLLGKTHRHCPECGAVQNPEKRYFPKDDEKVAVEDHQFVGADKHCGSCKAPNSAKAKHCTECGAPMDGSSEVKAVQDTPPKAAPKSDTSPPKKKGRAKLMLIGVAVLVVALICVAVFWKKTAVLTVSGHIWEKNIAVERFVALPQTDWCDLMPSDGYGVSRFRDIRAYNQIPDGETCTTKRVDNRDGTFSERQECTPKYRKEPVYDDKCRYTVNRWTENRTVQAKGASLAETPTWPQLNLPQTPAEVFGAERAGRRWETFTVVYTSKKGESYTCAFPEPVWRSVEDKSVWKAKVGALTNSLDCTSMLRAK